MVIAIHGVKICAQCFTRSEAICSLLFMEGTIMLISRHGVMLYAHCYARSEAMCSLLYME